MKKKNEIYLVNVKTIRMIAHIFVAFSEKLNFTKDGVFLQLAAEKKDTIFGAAETNF